MASDERIERLLMRVSDGDADAIGELVAVVGQQVFRLVANKLSNHETKQDIDDTVQEVLLALASAGCQGKLPRDAGRFKGWLRRVVIYKCADAIRVRQRERKVKAAMLANEVDNSDFDGRFRKVLCVAEKAMRFFGGDERMVVDGLLRGCSNQELADELGMTLASFRRFKRSFVVRAAPIFQRFWEDCDEEIVNER